MEMKCRYCGEEIKRDADGDWIDRELEKQQEIDISNLRFYSRMAAEHKWGTDVIHFGVIEQTLKEIADRLALLRRVSGKGAQREICGFSVDDKGTKCRKKPLHAGRCSVHPEPSPAPVPATHQLDIELAAVGRRVLDAIEEYGASDGLTDELEAAMHNLNLVIAALRRPTTQGTPEGK